MKHKIQKSETPPCDTLYKDDNVIQSQQNTQLQQSFNQQDTAPVGMKIYRKSTYNEKPIQIYDKRKYTKDDPKNIYI